MRVVVELLRSPTDAPQRYHCGRQFGDGGARLVLPVGSPSQAKSGAAGATNMGRTQDSTATEAAGAPSDLQLVGRLVPPRQRVATVPRVALLARMDGALNCPLSLVVSPPGFGKTTLLAQWWAQLRRRPGAAAAWLTLDEDDAEVTRFVAHLILAVREAGLSLGSLPSLAERQLAQADVNATVLQILDHIQASGKRVVIIIDDYHRIRSDAVDGVLDIMIRHSGARHSIVISGRERPRLATAGLEARGMVMSIDATDLALSLGETGALIDRDLTADDLAVLHSRTEGWPVAVQLAKLWLERGEGRRDQIATFSGRTIEVARYLLEQVLSDLAPELHDFLVETSILERFDGALADATRARFDSYALLARLTHLDALLVPLDAGREWFRYHHMFADYLRQRLLTRGSPGMNELHRRAAGHLAKEGETLEAVRHAQKGGDLDLAIELVRAAGGWEVILSQGVGFARSLLGTFRDEAIRSSPDLLLTRGYLAAKLGDLERARRCIDQAALMGAPGLAPSRDQVIVEVLLRTYADQVDDPSWRSDLAASVGRLSQGDHLGRATLRAGAALADLGTAAFASAELESRRGIREMHAAGSTLGATYCTFHLAQSRLYRGDVGQAEALFREALVAAEANYGSDSALKAIGSCFLGNVLYWRNEMTEARSLISSSLDAIDATDGWMDVYAVSYRTAAALDLINSGPSASLATLDRAEANARGRGLTGLVDLVDAWRLEVLATAGASADADAWAKAKRLEELHRQAQRPGRWRLRSALGMALAQWHLRGGRSAAAVAVLRPLQNECRAQERRLDGARADALAAAAFKQRGQLDEMLVSLAGTLDFIAVEQAPRVLFDAAAPVEPMLQIALAQPSEACPLQRHRALIASLLQRVRADKARELDGLSSRELGVLRQLCAGRSNKQIGWHLGLSENTVKFHLKRVYAKLDVSSRSAAIAAATRQGIFPPAQN
jgi:LuxR family transcriptional regulator, maltose regulon positive regulatory protein